MAWQNNPSFTIDKASALGQDLYEVLVSNWGVVNGVDPLADFTELQWPPGDNGNGNPDPGVPISLAAISLGPRSLVDRCWLSYNLQVKQTIASPASLLTDRLRRLSVDSPLYFTQASAPGAIDVPNAADNPLFTQVTKGALYVFAMRDTFGTGLPIAFTAPDLQDTTVLPRVYNPQSTPFGTRDFGFDAPFLSIVGGGSFNVFTPPLLHLQLHLKPPVATPPAKRFPMQLQSPRAGLVVPQSVETCVAQIPTFGRKTIVIQMVASFAATFRAGALRAMNQSKVIETTEATVAGGIDESTRMKLDTPCADYINLYATLTAGEPGIVWWTVTAYD